MNSCMNESINRWIDGIIYIYVWMNKCRIRNEWMRQWMNELMSKWKKWMIEWMKNEMNQSIDKKWMESINE